VADDPEHARLLLEAQERSKAQDKPEEWAPPMATWTPEVGLLAEVVDSINQLRITLIAANLERGKTPPKFEAYPRPKSALAKVRKLSEYERRKAAHEALVARLIPIRSQQ
jgi:hypothetical protein